MKHFVSLVFREKVQINNNKPNDDEAFKMNVMSLIQLLTLPITYKCDKDQSSGVCKWTEKKKKHETYFQILPGVMSNACYSVFDP